MFEKPRHRPVSECSLLVELSDQVELVANLKAISLARQLIQACPLGSSGIEAIVDLVTSFNTMLIEYKPNLLMQQDLMTFCNDTFQQLAMQPDIEGISRLIEIPVADNDRWCRACFEHYCQTINPIEDNLESVCRLSGLTSIQALIDHYTKAEWRLGAVGFVASLPTLMPLNADYHLHTLQSTIVDPILLQQALENRGGDAPNKIPWIIRLFENPSSWLPFPGKIDLYGHDCLHVLLNRGITLEDEAFIIGFTLGNDTHTQTWYLPLFKFISSTLYPLPYRFQRKHWSAFDWGVQCGRHAPIKNMNCLDFRFYCHQPVQTLRQWFGLESLVA